MEDQHPRYKVLVKVISQKGTCIHGHKVGDEWEMGSVTVGGICSGAFFIIHPRLEVLQCGGTLPRGTDTHSTTVACPDPDNPVVFEIRRILQ